MFNNIGGKIKGFAQIVCWLGIIGSIITGLVFIGIGSDSRNGGGIVFLGILIAIVGSIASWIGSFLTYGFGQLVENSDILVKQGNTPTNGKPLGNISTQGDCKKSVSFDNLTKPHWICKKCGRQNVASSTSCWNCKEKAQ